MLSYTLSGILLAWAIVVLGILGAPTIWVLIAVGTVVMLKVVLVVLCDRVGENEERHEGYAKNNFGVFDAKY